LEGGLAISGTRDDFRWMLLFGFSNGNEFAQEGRCNLTSDKLIAGYEKEKPVK